MCGLKRVPLCPKCYRIVTHRFAYKKKSLQMPVDLCLADVVTNYLFPLAFNGYRLL